MTIGAISDIHGILHHITIEQHMDVLCIAGDFSPLKLQRAITHKDGKRGTMKDWIANDFLPWLKELPADRIIVVPGNHDFVTQCDWFEDWMNETIEQQGLQGRIHYLCNKAITLYGVRFWGCPYSDLPNWAWPAHSPEDYTPKEDVDVLIVHAAPQWGNIGLTWNSWTGFADYGSSRLTGALFDMEHRPKLLLCGHIHGGDHKPYIFPGDAGGNECCMLNVAIKDEDYNEFWAPAIIEYNSIGADTFGITVQHWIEDSMGDSQTMVITNGVKNPEK